jgi:hypothetical protein
MLPRAKATLLGIAAAAIACGPQSSDGETPAEGAASPRMVAPDAAGSERERALGPFLSEHWALPVPEQGSPPAGFSEAEASLDPGTCGACHPEQLAQWQGSLHAGAFSPGFAGQLLEGALAAPAEVRSCQTCHTPLAEQQPFDDALSQNAGYDATLRRLGLVCAGCHVRSHRRYGPPRRAPSDPDRSDPDPRDATAPPDPAPHAGFVARAEFQESRFCAPCHQFFDDAGVNGKPIENTWNEWRASPQAAAGRTCQSCHMPERRHLWRGIHDPEMVRSAVDVSLAATALAGPELAASLVVTNRDVGHAFPTYVTPRVILSIAQIDAGGIEIGGTRSEAVIGREIDFGSWSEVFDTRLLPGGSETLRYAHARDPRAAALRARVVVDPDYHYRGVFDSLRRSYSTRVARDQMEEAFRRASSSSYTLWETRRDLPD